MARPDLTTNPHDAEPFHETLVRLSGLMRRDADLLDQIAENRLAIADALVQARYSLCQDCRENVAEDLPLTINWSAVALPAEWSSAGLYASYRDRVERAISLVAYRQEDQ